MKLRLGILINKFLTFICKLFGRNATVFPGAVVYDYFDKNILNKVNYPKYVIAVTGSSGKGSTCNYINHILTSNGYDVAYNAYGSNAIRGITTLILNNCDYKGSITTRM